MDLLTQEEYQAIADNLALPNNAFIDGSYRPAGTGKTFVSSKAIDGAIPNIFLLLLHTLTVGLRLSVLMIFSPISHCTIRLQWRSE